MFNKLKNSALLSGAMVYLVSNILNAMIPFLLLPVMTRYLGAEGYGQVGMFQTFLALLAAFVGLNVFGVLNRKYYDFGNDSNDDLKNYMAVCMQVLLVSSILVLAGVFLFLDELEVLVGISAEWLTLAILVATFQKVIRARLIQWQIRKESLKYGLFQVAQSLLNVLLSVLLVVAFYWGEDGRVAAQVATATIFMLVAFYIFKRDGLLRFFYWNKDYLREALRYGVPLVPHVAGLFLLNLVDRFFINRELGVAEVGLYMVALQMTFVMSVVFDALNKAYVPWLFERLQRNDFQEKRRIVRDTYIWFVLILGAVFVAFLLGPIVVTLVAGKEFEAAGALIGWLALGQGFGGMYLMVTNYIHFSKRTGLLSAVTIFSGLVNVLLLVVFIEKYGLKGAAYAFCVSMGIRFLLTWIVAQKRHEMPWFNFRG